MRKDFRINRVLIFCLFWFVFVLFFLVFNVSTKYNDRPDREDGNKFKSDERKQEKDYLER